MTMTPIQAMFAIQKATLAARARLSDEAISTQVKAGNVQVTRVTYDSKGNPIVTPLSDWLTADGAISYLNSMQ